MEFDSYLEQANRENKRFIRRIWIKLKHFWWLIGFSALAGLMIAFLIIRYSPKIYSIGAKVMIENSSEGIDPTSFLFGDELMGNNQEVVNELIILKSYPIIKQTVIDESSHIHYYRTTSALERVIEIEPWNSPFFVKTIGEWDLETGLRFDEVLRFEFTSDRLSIHHGSDVVVENVSWGEEVQINERTLIFEQNSKFKTETDGLDYFFVINGVEQTTQAYQEKVKASVAEEKSSIISIALEAALPSREVAFLQTLLGNYLASNLNEKNQGASNTIDFINSELATIKDSLKKIEGRLEVFKSRNQISNLQSEGQKIFEKLLELEEERAQYQLRDKYLNLVGEYLDGDDRSKLVTPTSFGIEDASLISITEGLLKLETERNLLGEEAVGQIAGQLDARILEMRKSLRNYISNISSTNSIRLEEVNRRMKIVEEAIEDLPVSEMALMNIERLHSLSESLYLLLLEKRAEAEITRSSNTPDVSIIEEARVRQKEPVKPNKRLLYIVCFLLGFGAPSIWILATVYFDNTVRTKNEITDELDLPFMGYTATSDGKERDYILENPKSGLAETFRTLRSNLKFSLGSESQSKVILVSSCFPGEGKTFVSSNLAMSLASAGKNVVVLGADLRKPTLQNVFRLENEVGLSSYLVGELSYEELVVKSDSGPDVIVSGPIPPNPLELLDSPKFFDLLQRLREEYDSIIIDTSPIVLVSDASALFRKTDINLLVLRSGVSQRANLELIRDLSKKSTGCRFGVVLNDYNLIEDYSYNYPRGYANGYGYYSDK